MSGHSDTDSFKSVQDEHIAECRSRGSRPQHSHHDPLLQTPANKLGRLSLEEEASLLDASNAHKSHANAVFASAHYSEAIQIYDKALSSLPSYFEYELSVLKCNIAACHFRLKEWDEVVDAATASLEGLERLDPTLKPTKTNEDVEQGVNGESRRRRISQGDCGSRFVGAVQEIEDETAARTEEVERSGRSREEVMRIRVKALMRRAKAREQLGGWAALQGAMEDYKDLSETPSLSPLDLKTVRLAQRLLPPKLEAAKQHEMGEMMGKLKDLGNGILKPFGLSTDNFKFTKDENSGGYSMNFSQGDKGREG